MIDRQAKITAICCGLSVGSLALLAAVAIGLDSLVPVLKIDDVFLGRSWPYVAYYFLADAIVMGALAVMIRIRPAPAAVVGLGWTGFVLLETLLDLPLFAHDPHMLLEELLFAMVYSVLLILLAQSARLPSARHPVAEQSVFELLSGRPERCRA